MLVLTAIVPQSVMGQEAALAWDQVKYFQYNILNVSYAAPTVTVVFSVTNPQDGNKTYDIKTHAAFKSPGTLRVDVAWNAGNWGTAELVNSKDSPFALFNRILPTPTTPQWTTTAPASAVAVNALTAAVANGDGTYSIKSTLPVAASGAGRVGIEGHPSTATGVSIPVKSIYQDFVISGTMASRRDVVDINKCKGCHDDKQHGDTIVPRLSLHGANRNEEPGVCVTCHNPNNTDAAYRTSGAEESIDFKRMIHGIHAGGKRKNPLIIIGRNGSVNDYSHVRFPSELRNCVNCHIDKDQKGTFELPMVTKLGTTISTGSFLGSNQIDIDPGNDLKISPIAATCSECHDDPDKKQHMIRMGASFGVPQSYLDNHKEQCVSCHAPGKIRDVRVQHQIRSTDN